MSWVLATATDRDGRKKILLEKLTWKEEAEGAGSGALVSRTQLRVIALRMRSVRPKTRLQSSRHKVLNAQLGLMIGSVVKSKRKAKSSADGLRLGERFAETRCHPPEAYSRRRIDIGRCVEAPDEHSPTRVPVSD